MVSWTVSVVSMASRKTRLAFWMVSRVSVLRVRFGILQAWHGWLDPVKVPEFQIDPLPKSSSSATADEKHHRPITEARPEAYSYTVGRFHAVYFSSDSTAEALDEDFGSGSI